MDLDQHELFNYPNPFIYYHWIFSFSFSSKSNQSTIWRSASFFLLSITPLSSCVEEVAIEPHFCYSPFSAPTIESPDPDVHVSPDDDSDNPSFDDLRHCFFLFFSVLSWSTDRIEHKTIESPTPLFSLQVLATESSYTDNLLGLTMTPLTNRPAPYPSLKQIILFFSRVDSSPLSTLKQIASLEQIGQDKYVLKL